MSDGEPVVKCEAVGMSDEDFLAQFESGTLPYRHWTHRAHLRVAYCYLTRFGLEETIPKVTAGIRAYNRSQGIVDTLTSGYHETMTVAWIHLVVGMLGEYGPSGAIDSAGALADLGDAPSQVFLAAQTRLWEKNLLRLYYSRERLGSPQAKYHFVLPDLTPLPGSKAE
jgi:hypothetical protein